MTSERPYASAIAALKAAGLRPTRQRVQLMRVLQEGGHRHLTAEQLRGEVKEAGLIVSLATIYNTLNQFTQSGLLREVVVEPGRSYFDTNTGAHHHFYFEAEGRLQDIPVEQVSLSALPAAPEGMRVARVDVVVRVAPK
ncbi:MAG: transcriptional repressor [Proteobacteria bacterium]|nr:transcriptional repressor [Pseudomonadota bacterium]